MRWAHSINPKGDRHSLREHLLATAELAGQFGAEFGAADAAYAVGLLHDAGKVSDLWQRRLMALESRLPAAAVDHKALGAVLSRSAAGDAGVCVIEGHHGGIPNKSECSVVDPDDALVQQLQSEVPEVVGVLTQGLRWPSTWTTKEAVEFGIRMLHSALVDADYLDTAAHFAATTPVVRPNADFTALAEDFDTARIAQLKACTNSAINNDRELVFQASVAAARGPRGIYRMTAPTGSGKTMAMAGFALHHAAVHGLRRVIVAMPFTTITEQNAKVLRDLIGEDNVLEHHSAIEPDDFKGYGVENWDAPVVVTTTVQLFESLYSNRPSKTRKLHRLCNSVIVLDEVQALPKQLLPPILDSLRILENYFGATVLLASATQPTFETLDSWKKLGVVPKEIVPDPPALYRRLTRVAYEWHTDWSMDDLVSAIAAERSSLTVVNTTATARELAIALRDRCGDAVLHLSTRMFRAHRALVLDEVRARLKAGEPVHLVSTQLIEAGVDVDFPVVFRQVAPAESLIQAGGRANREGRLNMGRVVVFAGSGFGSLKEYATGIGLTREHFGANPGLLNDPTALAKYFEHLFTVLNVDAVTKELDRWRRALWFRTVAELFRMIDSATTSVIVNRPGFQPFEDAVCLDSLSDKVVPMQVLRQMQAYSVDLPTRLVETEYRDRVLSLVPGVFVWGGVYSQLTGIGAAEPGSYLY